MASDIAVGHWLGATVCRKDGVIVPCESSGVTTTMPPPLPVRRPVRHIDQALLLRLQAACPGGGSLGNRINCMLNAYMAQYPSADRDSAYTALVAAMREQTAAAGDQMQKEGTSTTIEQDAGAGEGLVLDIQKEETSYLPWVLGGVAGVGLLYFMMKR